jgi:hypothetical protein
MDDEEDYALLDAQGQEGDVSRGHHNHINIYTL